jgi:hypothetical protein
VEKKAVRNIALTDADAEIGLVPVEGGGHKREPELDRLSNIIKACLFSSGGLRLPASELARHCSRDIFPGFRPVLLNNLR